MGLPDPVADEGLARRRRDQMKLVLVVAVPACQRRRVTVVEAADEADLRARLEGCDDGWLGGND